MGDRLTAPGLKARKGNEPLVWITAYDYGQAQVVEEAAVDVILVGDSVGTTVMGYSTTIPVTLDDMLYHARMVRRGAPNTMMVVDLPFLTYTSPEGALKHGGRLIQEALADAVKLEGGQSVLPAVDALVQHEIPVIGHLGLTPQSVHRMGGYRVQAKTADDGKRLVDDAVALAEHGVSALVLEGIPDRIASYVTSLIDVPTIGIGAGKGCDGQVLVFHDCLGLSSSYPKLAKPFRHLRQDMLEGLRQYRQEVTEHSFPDDDHTYHMSERAWQAFQDLCDQ